MAGAAFMGRMANNDGETLGRPRFADASKIRDSALRGLIASIAYCDTIEDKRKLIEGRVKSLTDLTELPDACFWGGEYQDVFAGRDKTTLELLRRKREAWRVLGRQCPWGNWLPD